MIDKDGHIYMPALLQQDVCQEAAMRRFRAFLADFDICVTNEMFRDADMGDPDGFQVICHLQAPTIYDVAVRLAKAGWIYTDSTEDRAAPFLCGPDGESVRISRVSSYARLVYTPTKADDWAMLVRQRLNTMIEKPVQRSLPAAAGMELIYKTGG